MNGTVPCLCRCHTGGPHASCDVDAGYGIGCGPHPGEIPLDEACVLSHPATLPRFVGLLCSRHYHWIDRTLDEIVKLYELLPEVLLPGPANGGDRHGTRDGSPAPGNLGVLTLTTAMPRAFRQDDPDDVPNVPWCLDVWVRLVLEELPDDPHRVIPDGTLTASVRFLHGNRHWIARQLWVDGYADELGGLHRAVARALGDTMWPKPVGRCPNCQTPMFNTVGIDELTCRKCRTTWRGVHVARLRLIHEKEGVEWRTR